MVYFSFRLGGGLPCHRPFVSRTVFVKNGDVQKAARTLNYIMGKDGIFDQFRYTRYFEKPCQTRRRVNYERCKSLHDEDMARRIKFVLRKNREDPFPGSF